MRTLRLVFCVVASVILLVAARDENKKCKEEKECANGGIRVKRTERTCVCAQGWGGDDCKTALCYPKCQNGGQCDQTRKCNCLPGYSGPDCSQYDCGSLGCPGGTCSQPNKCSCPVGFYGANCQVDCSQTNPCQNGGLCQSGCSCQQYFTGPLCQLLDCTQNPCQHGGTCVPGSTSCNCLTGWSGTFCTTSSGIGKFGGWYQYFPGLTPDNILNFVVNPITTNFDCPSGFNSYQVGHVKSGHAGVAVNQYLCLSQPLNNPYFGGAFETCPSGANDVNPVTGDVTCPAGFNCESMGLVKAATTSGEEICQQYACFTAYTGTLRGFYQMTHSGGTTDDIVNPATGVVGCPDGSTPARRGSVRTPDNGDNDTLQYICLFCSNPSYIADCDWKSGV